MKKSIDIKKYCLRFFSFIIIFGSVFFIEQYCNAQKLTLDNPLGTVTSPQILIGRVIQTALGLVGSIALIMFVYGGLTWMLSGGNSEKVTKGKNIIVWAVIGMVVVFTSYMAVSFIIIALTKG